MPVTIPEKPPATLVPGDHIVTVERHLQVDASGGNVVVTVPAASADRDRTIRKIDETANTVTVNEDGGGALATLTVPGHWCGLSTDGSAYTVQLKEP